MRRGALAAALVLAGAATAHAQSATGATPPVFLPRASFSFDWSNLHTQDKRFDWQGRVSVDFDVVTFGRSRIAFRGDYEAVLGRERRRYDLNQGNYFFESAFGHRLRGIELQAMIQHVSRHVVDRENVPAISWNLAGVRARRGWSAPGGRRVDGEIEVGRFTQPAFVDYAWASRATVTAREPLSTRVSFVGHATGEVIGVHRAIADRPRVCGGRVELAIRVNGRAAAFEVFGGYERRIDAFPTDRFRVRWFTVGFRVSSRE